MLLADVEPFFMEMLLIKMPMQNNSANRYGNEAFQGVKATCDMALKTGDMGIFKKREVTCLRC